MKREIFKDIQPWDVIKFKFDNKYSQPILEGQMMIVKVKETNNIEKPIGPFSHFHTLDAVITHPDWNLTFQKIVLNTTEYPTIPDHFEFISISVPYIKE